MTLTARIAERAALRFTPAGLPIVDVSLRHESEIAQAGGLRKLSFEIRGRAIGAISEALLAADLASDHVFAGFLGAQRNGRGIVFHIQSIASK